jgi:hypothetical protein
MATVIYLSELVAAVAGTLIAGALFGLVIIIVWGCP